MRQLFFALMAASCCAGLLCITPPAVAQDTPCMQGVESTPPAPTAAQRDYRRQLHSLATGRGVRVAIIDTGIAHSPQLSAVEDGPDLLTADDPQPRLDCDIHGTVVAGIIGGREAGLAPDATLISIRQSSAHYRKPDSDNQGAGTLETLAKAIEAAVDARAKIINVSVVSCLPSHRAAALDTTRLDAALRRAEDADALIVAAAGNVGGGCNPGDVVFPSHGSTVVSVAALGDSHDLASYSLPGRLAAPGEVAVGVGPQGWISGDTAPGSGQIQALQGTSFSAPVIAGTAALLAQRYPTDSPAALRKRLLAAAQPGPGYLDPLSALSAQVPTAAASSRTLSIVVPTTPVTGSLNRLITILAGLLGVGVLILARGGLQRRRAR